MLSLKNCSIRLINKCEVLDALRVDYERGFPLKDCSNLIKETLLKKSAYSFLWQHIKKL